MSEQPAQLERINWTGCLPFTHVFRAFKIARHPWMVVLAMAAMLLTLLWGSALDLVWRLSKSRPVVNEVFEFWQQPHLERWRQERRSARLGEINRAYGAIGRPVPKEIDGKKLADDPDGAVSLALKDLKKGYEEASASEKDDHARAALAARYRTAYGRVSSLGTEGVFCGLIRYEASAVRRFVLSAATLDFFAGLGNVMQARQIGTSALAGVMPPEGVPLRPDQSQMGALASLVLMARGAQWLVTEHPFFAVLLVLGKLAIWSLFGGAICRMAALNFTRDEHIPLKGALSFARRKYLGFLLAPLMPIGIILVIGAVLWVGGFICQLPYLGDLLGGLGMGLALMGGGAIAIVLIGFLAGVSLMWPTVAAEGSDAFDAMSRSYSYVLTRPWKAALYALAASIYGAICYLFVRLLVWIILRATRAFVGAGMSVWTARPGTGLSQGSKIDAIWPTPTFDNLWPGLSPFGYQRGFEWLAMGLTWIWVMLVVLALGGFLVSFYYSAATIIYFLLRRDVDHTDLEDVDTEGEEEEEAIHASAGAVAVEGAAAGAGSAAGSTGETSS
ncbi:MAG: hypothetical protein AMXMBFR83_00620 [Phycisphaerae bacterium]